MTVRVMTSYLHVYGSKEIKSDEWRLFFPLKTY
jgi:hypothetical protein